MAGRSDEGTPAAGASGVLGGDGDGPCLGGYQSGGRGFLRLIDSETGIMREVMVDEVSVKRYRQKLEQHQQNWNRACRQVGAMLISLVAEEFVQTWQLNDLVAQGILNVI